MDWRLTSWKVLGNKKKQQILCVKNTLCKTFNNMEKKLLFSKSKDRDFKVFQ